MHRARAALLAVLWAAAGARALECAAGSFRDVSVVNRRAIALVPGRAQFATFAARNGAAPLATAGFNGTGGPPPAHGGAVTFSRATRQYLDAGPRDLNISSNGGFTAVAVVMFTGAPGTLERVFDLSSGIFIDNIALFRTGATNTIQFAVMLRPPDSFGNFQHLDSLWCKVEAPVTQNSWLTIVALYSNGRVELRVMHGQAVQQTATHVCSEMGENRAVPHTYVGMSAVGGPFDPSYENLQARVAGLYAVDARLSEAEIARTAAQLRAGGDALQTCEPCPAGSSAPAGSAGGGACLPCAAGTSSGAGLACTPCPNGTHAARAGAAACADNPPLSASSADGTGFVCNAGARHRNGTCELCAPGTFQALAGAARCEPCPRGTFLPTAGAAGGERCRACPAGTYLNATGSVAQGNCTACPLHANTSAAGSAGVAACQCVAGAAGAGGGQTARSACRAGTSRRAGRTRVCSVPRGPATTRRAARTRGRAGATRGRPARVAGRTATRAPPGGAGHGGGRGGLCAAVHNADELHYAGAQHHHSRAQHHHTGAQHHNTGAQHYNTGAQHHHAGA